MTTDRELMQWALAALDGYAQNCQCEGGGGTTDAAEALRARLAQPEQQHSEQWWRHEVSNAWAEGYEKGRLQREWQSLTDEEIFAVENSVPDAVITDRDWCVHFARAIEAKLKEKNT